jgi:glycosyltransferase 2 family protein
LLVQAGSASFLAFRSHGKQQGLMKRIIALIITILVLALLYLKVDRAALARNLASTNWGYFALAVVLFVPQISIIAFRWQMLVKPFSAISTGEGVRMILASQTLNLVFPSKLGDLMKGVFLSRTGALDATRGMNIVVFEKMLDVASLAFLMLCGALVLWLQHAIPEDRLAAVLLATAIGAAALTAVLVLYFLPVRWWASGIAETSGPGKVARLVATCHEVISVLQSRGARRGRIILVSLFIWFLHMAQIYAFFRSLNIVPPLFQFLSLVPLAIFVGLLPLTIAGFGTRDAALVLFFPQFPRSVMLAVALYVNLRYILPSICGIPFLSRYATYTRAMETG